MFGVPLSHSRIPKVYPLARARQRHRALPLPATLFENGFFLNLFKTQPAATSRFPCGSGSSTRDNATTLGLRRPLFRQTTPGEVSFALQVRAAARAEPQADGQSRRGLDSLP